MIPVIALAWTLASALAWGRPATAQPLVVPATSDGEPVPTTLVVTTPSAPAPLIIPRPAGSATDAPRKPFWPLAPLAPFVPVHPVGRPEGPGHPPAPIVPPRPAPLAPRTPVSPDAPAGPLRETAGKREPSPVRVPVTPPRPPAVRAIPLPSSVVLHALDAGQPAFLRCWARSHRTLPAPSSGKIQLHVDVDAGGSVIASHSDTDSPDLERCLNNVARHLPFPASGHPAAVELSLMFPVTP